MTALKKARSNNWVAADNDFGDVDCLEDEILGPKIIGRKRGRGENNNTVKSGSISRSMSAPAISPPKITGHFEDVSRVAPLLADTSQLWVNKHRPKQVEELAVATKKIEEVRWWLENRRGGGILLLTGPSGAGKTATLLALTHKLGLGVTEWVNPIEQVNFGASRGLMEDDNHRFDPHDTVSYSSKGKQFKDWMRGARYSPLCSSSSTNTSQVILIEDLPTQAYSKPEEFHAVLESFAGAKSGVPIVFVISETASAKKSGSVKQVFPPEFIQKLSINFHMINFNPVTTTNIVKVLNRIGTLEAREGMRKFKVPEKAVLESLADSVGGDIRGAINAFQFSCLNDTKDLGKAFEGVNTGRGSNKSKKKGSKEGAGSAQLSRIGGKDQSLVMFHALGKVLYAKRTDQTEPFTLPRQLLGHTRKTLKSSPEEVVERTTLSADPFTCFLHHNYPAFYTKIEDVTRLTDYLSMSDLFLKEWGTAGKMSLGEYGSSVAARAVMFCNSAMTPNLGMRKLTKPEYYLANRTERNRLYSQQSMFQTQGAKELSTSTIPLLARIRPGHLSTNQMATISEIGSFSGLKSVSSRFTQALEQNDIFDEDEELLNNVTKEKQQQSEPCQMAVIEEEEEVIIEDFDD